MDGNRLALVGNMALRWEAERLLLDAQLAAAATEVARLREKYEKPEPEPPAPPAREA